MEILIDPKSGDYWNGHKCPVANAINPMLADGYVVLVGGTGHFYILEAPLPEEINLCVYDSYLYAGRVPDIDAGVMKAEGGVFIREVNIPERFLCHSMKS